MEKVKSNKTNEAKAHPFDPSNGYYCEYVGYGGSVYSFFIN